MDALKSLGTSLLVTLCFAWVDQIDRLVQPQISVPCKVVSVHDGDTLTADITFRVNVRLLDCWAPELRDAGGPASRDKLKLLADGKEGILTIPLGSNVGQSFTFGRALGHVVIDGKDVSQQMVDAGLATKTRTGE